MTTKALSAQSYTKFVTYDIPCSYIRKNAKINNRYFISNPFLHSVLYLSKTLVILSALCALVVTLISKTTK